jgi:hypothetical protein
MLDLICQNCKNRPTKHSSIHFSQDHLALKVRWGEELAFGTFQSQKLTPGGSKTKGKGPPPRCMNIPNPDVLDYKELPTIMDLECTALCFHYKISLLARDITCVFADYHYICHH